MASPRAIVQILVSGTRILGKAFYEAGRQAVANAKHNPAAAAGADVGGMTNANSGSPSDQLTRLHRMTLDEAQLILNTKDNDSLEEVLKHYEHLFKANSPAPKPEKPVKQTSKTPFVAHSHYLQSKVVRARERIEAEIKLAQEPPQEEPVKPAENPTPPPQ